MAKMGRPPKPIDWKLFEQLCHIQCTHTEIASFCNISVENLYDRAEKEYNDTFARIYKRFADGGKCSLRRQQFKMAEKNCSMAIWLGKQHLGQREPEPVQQNSKNDKALDLALEIIKKPENQIKAEELNATQHETALQHPTGECAVQHMDRSGEERQDVCESIQAD